MERQRARTRKPSATHADPAPAGPPRPDRPLEKPPEIRRVRLTRKYAEAIDGVDLSGADVGDRLTLSPHDAEVLIAEGWAEPAPVPHNRRAGDLRCEAADEANQSRATRKNRKR